MTMNSSPFAWRSTRPVFETMTLTRPLRMVVDEHVLHRRGRRIEVLDEEHARPVGRFAELARRDARDLGALLEARLELARLPIRPRRDEQARQPDDDRDRDDESKHRAQPARQAEPGRLPDDHLGVAIAARHRQQDRDEDRELHQHRQVVQRREHDQREDRSVVDLPGRGLAEHADERDRQHDRQQRDEDRARRADELTNQRALEDHRRSTEQAVGIEGRGDVRVDAGMQEGRCTHRWKSTAASMRVRTFASMKGRTTSGHAAQVPGWAL